jgi:hypothetical protein
VFSASSRAFQAEGAGQVCLAVNIRATLTTSVPAIGVTCQTLTQKCYQQCLLSAEEEGILPTDLMRDGFLLWAKIKLVGRYNAYLGKPVNTAILNWQVSFCPFLSSHRMMEQVWRTEGIWSGIIVLSRVLTRYIVNEHTN